MFLLHLKKNNNWIWTKSINETDKDRQLEMKIFWV